MDKQDIEKQLSFKPEVVGPATFSYSRFVAAGMGGSALPMRVMNFLDPSFPLSLHNTFDLPAKTEPDTLYVAVSYSGNTEETLSFADEAVKRGFPLAVIASGGKLGELAKDKGLPFIKIPEGYQPRESVVYQLKALLLIFGREDLAGEFDRCQVDFGSVESEGKKIAESFSGKIPVIYSSIENRAVGYIWKIIFNESGKIPAFNNFFPELVHNEMQGMVPKTSGEVAGATKVLLLKDSEDDSRLQKYEQAFEKNALELGIEIDSFELPPGKVNKFVNSWLTARVAAEVIAESHGVDPESIPLIAAFKKEIAK